MYSGEVGFRDTFLTNQTFWCLYHRSFFFFYLSIFGIVVYDALHVVFKIFPGLFLPSLYIRQLSCLLSDVFSRYAPEPGTLSLRTNRSEMSNANVWFSKKEKKNKSLVIRLRNFGCVDPRQSWGLKHATCLIPLLRPFPCLSMTMRAPSSTGMPDMPYATDKIDDLYYITEQLIRFLTCIKTTIT